MIFGPDPIITVLPLIVAGTIVATLAAAIYLWVRDKLTSKV